MISFGVDQSGVVLLVVLANAFFGNNNPFPDLKTKQAGLKYMKAQGLAIVGNGHSDSSQITLKVFLGYLIFRQQTIQGLVNLPFIDENSSVDGLLLYQ